MATRKVSVAIVGEDRLSGPLDVIKQKVGAFRDSSERMGQGLGRVSNLLGDMARSSIGATGPVGRLLETVLQFGIGSGALALLAGGVALVVGHYNRMGAAAKQAREETDKLVRSTLEAAKTPQDRTFENLATLDKRIGDINRQLGDDRRRRSIPILGPTLAMDAEQIGRLTAELVELEAARDALRGGAVVLPELDVTAKSGKAVAAQAAEQARRENAALLARNLARQREERIAAAGGGNVIGTAGAAPPDGAIPDILKGATPEMYESARAAEAAAAAGKSMSQSFEEAAESTLAVGDALGAINDSLLGSVPGFGQVAKAASLAAGVVARVEGTIAVAKGAVKIAESLFPFNPAGLASGAQMIATGKRLAALGGGGAGGGGGGGGGGGSGARGNGGGLSPENSGRNREEATAGRAGTHTVSLRRGYVRTDDPDFQDFIRELNRGGEGRDVQFRYTG